jgi:glutaredoxin 3
MSEIKMYTRELCGYCAAAKSLLEGKRLAFEEIDCTGDDQIRSWLRVKTGQSTVPQIFIHGQSIGGFTELRNLDRSGRLEKMLAEGPAAEEEEP